MGTYQTNRGRNQGPLGVEGWGELAGHAAGAGLGRFPGCSSGLRPGQRTEKQGGHRLGGLGEGGALVRVRPPSPLNRPQPRGGNGSAMAASRKLLSRLGRLRVLAAQSWTPWTVAQQAPLSTGFSRQEYWSGLPFPPPGDLPNPGIKPKSPISQADSLPSEPPGKPSTPLKAALWPLTIPGIQPL